MVFETSRLTANRCNHPAAQRCTGNGPTRCSWFDAARRERDPQIRCGNDTSAALRPIHWALRATRQPGPRFQSLPSLTVRMVASLHRPSTRGTADHAASQFGIETNSRFFGGQPAQRTPEPWGTGTPKTRTQPTIFAAQRPLRSRGGALLALILGPNSPPCSSEFGGFRPWRGFKPW